MKKKLTKLNVVIPFLLSAMYMTSVRAETATCPSIADVYIDQYKPDENLNITRILISYHPSKGVARGLFKFDIPESIDASEITDATLYLSGSYHTGGGFAIAVNCYALNEPFDEGNDTWNTLSGGDYDTSVTSPGTLPAGNDWETSIDVTTLVTGNLEKLKDYGILIRLQSEGGSLSQYQNIASRECVDPEDFAPYLEIVYLPDSDQDDIPDAIDNCPNNPNGSLLGTCVTTKAGMTVSYRVGSPKAYIICTSDADCISTGGTCQMGQGDCNANNTGDACECYANFNYPADLKVNTSDLALLKADYGRIDCSVPPECKADGNGDGRVNTSDLSLLKNEYGRIDCPALP